MIASLDKPEASDKEDVWMPHTGSGRPVAPDVIVEVKYRNGETEIAPASDWDDVWYYPGHQNTYVNIVAYRITKIVEEKKPEKQTLQEYAESYPVNLETSPSNAVIDLISAYLERDDS